MCSLALCLKTIDPCQSVTTVFPLVTRETSFVGWVFWEADFEIKIQLQDLY